MPLSPDNLVLVERRANVAKGHFLALTSSAKLLAIYSEKVKNGKSLTDEDRSRVATLRSKLAEHHKALSAEIGNIATLTSDSLDDF